MPLVTLGKLATVHYSQGFYDAAVYVVKPDRELTDGNQKDDIYLQGQGDAALLTILGLNGEPAWHGTVSDAIKHTEFKSWVEQERSVIFTPLGWFARQQRRLNRLLGQS